MVMPVKIPLISLTTISQSILILLKIDGSNFVDSNSQTEVGLNLPPTGENSNVNPNASLNVEPNVNPLLVNDASQTVDRSNLDQTTEDRNHHRNDAQRTANFSVQTDLVENPLKTPKNSVMDKTPICKFHLQGICTHGIKRKLCKFLHPNFCRKYIKSGLSECNLGDSCKYYQILNFANFFKR